MKNVQCLYLDGLNTNNNADNIVTIIRDLIFDGRDAFSFASARMENEPITRKYKIKQIKEMLANNKLCKFENFSLFSSGNENRDYFRPLEFVGYNKYDNNAEMFAYSAINIRKMQEIAVDMECIYNKCAYVYDYYLNRSPLSYFNGASFVGEDDDYMRSGIEDGSRIARWRSARYASKIENNDIRPRDLFSRNFWKRPVYNYMVEIGVIKDLNSIGLSWVKRGKDIFYLEIAADHLNTARAVMDKKRALVSSP